MILSEALGFLVITALCIFFGVLCLGLCANLGWIFPLILREFVILLRRLLFRLGIVLPDDDRSF